MGSPKRDGVHGAVSVPYNRHGLRHGGRGVRVAESQLIRSLMEGAEPRPTSGRKARIWKLEHYAEGAWHATHGKYHDLRAAQAASQSPGKASRLWLEGYPLRLADPEAWRAVNTRTGEVVSLPLTCARR